MGTRVRRSAPRAHWPLLVLGMLVLLAELCLNGYVTHVGAEGSGPHEPPGGTAPADVTNRAAVQRLQADGTVTSRGMPARTIALTFDDGPDPTWTPRILAVLARHHAHATFFEVGSRVNQHPQISRDVLAAGHEIGTHTFTHAELATIPAWRQTAELTLAGNAIAAATGRTPHILRPPYSSIPEDLTSADDAAARRAEAAGYLLVLADRDSQDWRRPGTAAIVRAAQPATPGAGAIVMMHDSGGNREQTVAALDILIPRLQAQGYRFVTVSEGLRIPPTAAATTGQRLRGQLLRVAQLAGAWLTRAITILMLAAVILALLRLVVQVITADIHRRRVRRRNRDGLAYLGPVSIIVPAYNEAANIEATVRSLLANDYPWREVIVVDDGSTDGTADIVERLQLPDVYVLRQANAGKPAALNTGIAYAHGDLLVLVDGDTVFTPDAVGRLVQPLRDPRVGAVSGNTKVVNRDGLLGRWQHLEYVIGFNLDRRMFDLAQCMPTVPGAIGAFRRAALEQIGGVPADTLAEDTDLTMAVIRAGWRVVHQPTAIAWTEAPATLRQLWRQRYRWCYGTMQAMWKHRHALFERGPGGRLGRRGVGYLMLFQVLLPLTAPMVDVYAIYGLLFLPLGKVIATWAGFTAIQIATAAYALRLDGERYGPLWSLPLQQVVYRQLMYLVVVQSTVMALTGGRLRWHRMVRTGAAAAAHPPPAGGPPPAPMRTAPPPIRPRPTPPIYPQSGPPPMYPQSGPPLVHPQPGPPRVRPRPTPPPVHSGPPHHRPPYGEPSYGRPSYGPPSRGEPSYGGQPHGHLSDGAPTHGEPSYGPRHDGEPSYSRLPHGEPSYGRPPHGQPWNGRPPHPEPSYGAPPHDEPTRNQPPHAQSPRGFSPHAEPMYNQPPHGERPRGFSPHAEPMYNQPPHAEPMYNQPPHAEPTYRPSPYDDPAYNQPPYGGRLPGLSPDAAPFDNQAPFGDGSYSPSTDGAPPYNQPTRGRRATSWPETSHSAAGPRWPINRS